MDVVLPLVSAPRAKTEDNDFLCIFRVTPDSVLPILQKRFKINVPWRKEGSLKSSLPRTLGSLGYCHLPLVCCFPSIKVNSVPVCRVNLYRDAPPPPLVLNDDCPIGQSIVLAKVGARSSILCSQLGHLGPRSCAEANVPRCLYIERCPPIWLDSLDFTSY